MNISRKWTIAFLMLGLGASFHLSAATSSDYTPPTAGVKPFERPAGAPVIQQFEKNKQWHEQAVTGVVPPFPASFSFLNDQEAWYTPFNRPGMRGWYDIRGWHTQ